jgi:hypothetical protein
MRWVFSNLEESRGWSWVRREVSCEKNPIDTSYGPRPLISGVVDVIMHIHEYKKFESYL